MIQDKIYKDMDDKKVTMKDLTRKLNEVVTQVGMHEVMEKLSEMCGQEEDENES